jgi:hypothetical protein
LENAHDHIDFLDMARISNPWANAPLWISLMAILQACAPLTGGNSTNTANCTAAILGNSQGVGLNQIGFLPPNQFVTVTTSQLAQSFLASSATPITAVSLNLDYIAPAGIQLSGSVSLDIEQDSTINLTTPTPTSPNGSTLGTAITPVTSITTAANFVSFDFSATPITLTPGYIYWLVATPSYGASSTTYVEWRAEAESIPNSLSDYFSSFWTTLSTTLNLDFKIGC